MAERPSLAKDKAVPGIEPGEVTKHDGVFRTLTPEQAPYLEEPSSVAKLGTPQGELIVTYDTHGAYISNFSHKMGVNLSVKWEGSEVSKGVINFNQRDPERQFAEWTEKDWLLAEQVRLELKRDLSPDQDGKIRITQEEASRIIPLLRGNVDPTGHQRQ